MSHDTLKRLEATLKLLRDVRDQYERRKKMFESAGGDPAKMEGALTAYLLYSQLKEVFDE